MIIDASALLALLHDEPGADSVAAALADGSMTAVNLSEVAAKLVQHGVPDKEMKALLQSFDLDIIQVDETIAFAAGSLFKITKDLGLSLGDRICIASAILAETPVLTADRAWQALVHTGLKIVMIR